MSDEIFENYNYAELFPTKDSITGRYDYDLRSDDMMDED